MISKGVLLWRHQLFLSMLSQGSLWFSAMFSFLGAPTPHCPLPSICSSALGQLRSRAQLGLRKDLEDPQLCFVLGFFFPSHFLKFCSVASVFSFLRLYVSDSCPWHSGTISAISWCSVILNPLSL